VPVKPNRADGVLPQACNEFHHEELTLDEPASSRRELAVRFTDTKVFWNSGP
jgi:hypothetical protein